MSLSEASLWSAGSPFLQWHHSSIIEGRFTNERRSAPSFIRHCRPRHPFFPVSFYSSLLPSHCLACSRMWRKRRTRQCYQHATDDSFEGDRDFQLLPQWLITHTPQRVDARSPLSKTKHQSYGRPSCIGANACFDFSVTPMLRSSWVQQNVKVAKRPICVS